MESGAVKLRDTLIHGYHIEDVTRQREKEKVEVVLALLVVMKYLVAHALIHHESLQL